MKIYRIAILVLLLSILYANFKLYGFTEPLRELRWKFFQMEKIINW